MNSNNPTHNRDRPNPKGSINLVNCQNTNNSNCPLCGEAHNLSTCSVFAKLDTEARWNEVRKLRLCFLCLKRNHQVRDCRVKVLCGVDDCTRRHQKKINGSNRLIISLCTSSFCNDKKLLFVQMMTPTKLVSALYENKLLLLLLILLLLLLL